MRLFYFFEGAMLRIVGATEDISLNCCTYQIPTDHTMLVTITPAIKPARDDARIRPILKRNVLCSWEVKSFAS